MIKIISIESFHQRYQIQRVINCNKKKMYRTLIILLMLCLGKINLSAQKDYSLKVVKNEIKDLPQVHSYANGIYDGKLLIIGGRTGSPSSYINFDLILIDPEADKFWQKSIETYALKPSFIEHLSSSNTASIQIGNYLYIAGGLGYRVDQDAFGTLPYLTRIDIKKVCESILYGSNNDDFICQIENEIFASMESSLLKSKDDFYLIGGFNMKGNFNKEGELEIVQSDLKQYNAFTLNETEFSIELDMLDEIKYKEESSSSSIKAISYRLPNAKNGIVFIQNEEHITGTTPDWFKIESDHSISIIQNQGKVPFSHAVTIPFYDNIDRKMYTYFLGGCNEFLCYEKQSYTNNTLNEVDVIVVNEDEEVSFQSEMIDELLLQGKDGIFIPVNQPSDGILELSSDANPKLIGYIYGGSTAPSPMFYSDGTTVDSALNQFFEVYITKERIVNQKF